MISTLINTLRMAKTHLARPADPSKSAPTHASLNSAKPKHSPKTRRCLAKKIVHAIRYGDLEAVKKLDESSALSCGNPLFLCSALYREEIACADYFLEKGVDVHASVESYNAEGIKGDAVLWTAYAKYREYVNAYRDTPAWRTHGAASLGPFDKKGLFFETAFLKILATEPNPDNWTSPQARALAIMYSDDSKAYQKPSGVSSLNGTKIKNPAAAKITQCYKNEI